MRLKLLTAVSAFALLACGDDADPATDTTSPETSGEVAVETSEEVAAETTAETTAETVSDTSDEVAPETIETNETSEPETTTETCRCTYTGGCSEYYSGCGAALPLCPGDGETNAACDTSDVMAKCERTTNTQFFGWQRIDDWLANAKSGCEDGVAGTAGTFTVTPIPEGVGEVCSCQRTAVTCVQTYGTACANFSCEAGLQASACATDDRLPGRCITRDGQRELVISSPTSVEEAQLACHGASATEYYWIPDGL